MERNIPICGPNGKPQVKEASIRDLLRWCERQTETGTAPFGVCAADVQVDVTVGSAQSRVNSRRRRLAPTEEGIFMTPTGRRHFGSFGILEARGILSRKWEPGGGWPQQEVETIDTELKDKFPRKQPMASGQKRRWESGARHFFGNDGFAIGEVEAGFESNNLGT